jgi:hypothetical protein
MGVRAPIISLFAKKCGKWHTLRKNDELKAIKTSPALFVVFFVFRFHPYFVVDPPQQLVT